MKFFILLTLFIAIPTSVNAKSQEKSVLEELKYRVGDEEENEKRALKTEMLVSKSEKLAIKQTKLLLKKYRGSSMEPEFMFRLAELYMRRTKTARFFELQRTSKGLVNFLPPFAKKMSSKRTIRQAISIYEKVERKFPRYKNIDLVVFNHAFARQQLNHRKIAEKLYKKVIDRYKSSPLVPDCHLAIGEMAFSDKNFQKALANFNAIKKYPNSRVYPYGVYKAAWSKYNLSDAPGAMQELEEVVRFGRFVVKNKIDARLDLRREALDDMTIFFEDVYPSNSAFAYFKTQAGELPVEPILIRMANLYKRHSRYKDENVILKDFVKKLDRSIYMPEVMEKLVQNYESQKVPKFALFEMDRFFGICTDNKKWLNSLAKDPKAIKEASGQCWERYKTVTHKLSYKWLQRWQKYKKKPYAGFSEKALKAFLNHPEKTPRDRKARYSLAELLFKVKKYGEASLQYEIVGSEKNDKMGHDSLYASIVSLEKQTLGKKKKGKWTEEAEKRLDSLVNKYVAGHPKGKYRLDVEFNLALIHYDKSRFDIAAPHFKKLGKLFSHKDKGLRSQDLYLDILNHQKKYKELTVYAGNLVASTKNTKRKAQILKVYQQSYFLQVQEMEKNNETDKAIVEYKKFAKENRKSPLAPKAWWNAIQLQYDSNQPLQAAQDAIRYSELFPKNARVKEALIRAAQEFESVAHIQSAVKVVEKLAVIDSAKRDHWKDLAAQFYYTSGDRVRYQNHLMDLSKSPKVVTKASALHRLAELFKANSSKYDSYQKQLASLGVQPYAGEAQLHFVQKVFANSDYANAFRSAATIVGAKGKNGPSSAVQAQARLIQAKILKLEFEKQSVKTRIERVATVIALKTEKLEKAQRAFQAVVRYGDAKTSVKALKLLADCYSTYVSQLKGMPDPKGLPEDQKQGFRSEISNLLLPIEDKAVETIGQAITVAKQARLRDGTIAELQATWNQLNLVNKPVLKMSLAQLPPVLPGFRQEAK